MTSGFHDVASNQTTANDLNKDLPKRGLRLALMPTLTVGVGALVLFSVGAIMVTNWISSRIVVQELASRLITRVLSAQEMALRRRLDEATAQADFIAAAIKSGRYRFADPALGDFIAGTLAAASEVDGLYLGDASGSGLRLVRGETPNAYQLARVDAAPYPELTAMAAEIGRRKEPHWGPPVYREPRQTTYLNYRVPIHADDGTYLGFLLVGISTRNLSQLTKMLSAPPRSTSFMLYGKDLVLAHPLMTAAERAVRTEASPLPTLAAFGDPVIANLFQLPALDEFFLAPPPGVIAREPTVDGESYVVLAREIADYGDLPITVGVYFQKRAIDAPLLVLYRATLIAVALLGLALIAAVIMSRAIVRPVTRAARGAAAIGSLDFDQVAPLEGSVFREIYDLAESFNAMLDALKAFGRYVPRTLVSRLVKEGRFAAGTEERVLVIMFTDIVNFTTTCETMSAGEVAAFVNHHLALVSACVEREGGTIDKFIGDAVMAFWGAPGRVEYPAASAARAALAIARALAADNTQRIAKGLAPVHVRIGIHVGPVVVGDIGSPNRINYTIVGDAVNAAQRLESLGKAIDPAAETITLLSQDVADALPKEFHVVPRGTHQVKGKQESLEVFQLVGEPDRA